MTNLTLFSPAAAKLAMVTLASTSGITSSLQVVQDGQGVNTALELSTTTVNVVGTLQVNGTTVSSPNAPLQLTVLPGPGDPAVQPGAVYYRSSDNTFRKCDNVGWTSW